MKIGDLEINRVEVLSLQPNDILIVHVPGNTLADVHERIKATLESFGITNKVIVATPDVDFEVLRKEAE